MFLDRPDSDEKAVLVHLIINSEEERDDPKEFEELALSAGACPVAKISGTRRQPAANYFIGSGKLEELVNCVRTTKAKLVLFNHSLSPSQERNLEKHLNCRVLDRTGLILDIFAQRARSHEGKLQVELAQLKHLSTRLKRGWTHLDRQKGGIGLKGAGETQLELDQRMIRQRIKAIHKGLDKVRSQRQQGRRSRQRTGVPTVSLVGYTNAGKSTLFNTLTNAQNYAADQLFATLDSTLRRLELPNLGPAIVADTVGFISHLPHGLVDAFRATLEETALADLLLHVIDGGNEAQDELQKEVESVLTEIDADQVPRLEVVNKIDRVSGYEPRLLRNDAGLPVRVWVSAKTGAGLDLLLTAMTELLAGGLVSQTVILRATQAKLRSHLYESKFVTAEQTDETGASILDLRLPKAELDRILAQEEVQLGESEYARCGQSDSLAMAQALSAGSASGS
ncbi:MAG: GTPase HflX [Gammaproteobacteria bacterium]|nr:GTPase HflX [Gammaproteobacteria bacterium]